MAKLLPDPDGIQRIYLSTVSILYGQEAFSNRGNFKADLTKSIVAKQCLWLRIPQPCLSFNWRIMASGRNQRSESPVPEAATF